MSNYNRAEAAEARLAEAHDQITVMDNEAERLQARLTEVERLSEHRQDQHEVWRQRAIRAEKERDELRAEAEEYMHHIAEMGDG